jgi:hypothetical protein
VIEIGQRFRQVGAERAERRHRLFRQKGRLRQPLAFQIFEQAYLKGLLADVDGDDVLPVGGGDDARHARGARHVGEMADGGVLGFEFQRLVDHVADLQDVSLLTGIDAVVAVLLAAEFGERAGEAIARQENVAGLRSRHVRTRKLETLSERFIGHGIPPPHDSILHNKQIIDCLLSTSGNRLSFEGIRRDQPQPMRSEA